MPDWLLVIGGTIVLLPLLAWLHKVFIQDV